MKIQTAPAVFSYAWDRTKKDGRSGCEKSAAADTSLGSEQLLRGF